MSVTACSTPAPTVTPVSVRVSLVRIAGPPPKIGIQLTLERTWVQAAPAVLVPVCGAIGVALFALVIYAGYAGVDSYTANFDPTFIYVIFWVGVPVASVVFGDLFSAFSPWRAVARSARWLARRAGVGRPVQLAYPAWLGRWPVVTGLVAFGWLELIYHDHDNPGLLASLSLAYFALMLLGMALFGIEEWTDRGDAFGGYFNLLSRLAAFEVRDRRRPASAATPTSRRAWLSCSRRRWPRSASTSTSPPTRARPSSTA